MSVREGESPQDEQSRLIRTLPLITRFRLWKIGVGSGGRTHDIQSHSLAFCH